MTPTEAGLLIVHNPYKPIDYVIDPGHGGKDPGGGTNHLFKESELALKISIYQYERGIELGHNPALVRNKDVYLDPNARTFDIARLNIPYGISNHINSIGFDVDRIKGCEVIHSVHNDGKIAKSIYNELTKLISGRRVFSKEHPRPELFKQKKVDYYYMHRKTGKCSMQIIEYGFGSHPGERQVILDKWQQLAEAAFKGFIKAIDLHYETFMPTDDFKRAVNLKLFPSVDHAAKLIHGEHVTERLQAFKNLLSNVEAMTLNDHLTAPTPFIKPFPPAGQQTHVKVINPLHNRIKAFLEQIEGHVITLTSFSDETQQLQAMLNLVGFDCGFPTKTVGPKTLKAIKAFQRLFNRCYGGVLDVDGVWGPMTLKAFKSYFERLSGEVNIMYQCSSDVVIQRFSKDTVEFGYTYGKFGVLESVKALHEQLLKDKDVIAMMNGSFFDFGSKFSYGLIYENGKTLTTPNKDFLNLTKRPGLINHTIDHVSSFDEAKVSFKDAIYSIPGSWAYVSNGSPGLFNEKGIAHYAQDNPRSIFVEDDTHFYFVTIDGRDKDNQGMTAYEVYHFLMNQFTQFYDTKIYNALNFDGGYSTMQTRFERGQVRVLNATANRIPRQVELCLTATRKDV